MKHYFTFLLALLLLADLTYSFTQHYSMPLDGDMVSLVLPADNFMPVLNDPLGLTVLHTGGAYPNPNRFFAHWPFYTYFNQVPGFLQQFTTPLNSVYLAAALAKILIQVLLLWLLAVLVSGKVLHHHTLLAAVLMTPFFQTNGFRSYLGIIDSSSTYTFFYALAALLLLIYLAPLLLRWLHDSELPGQRYWQYGWLLLVPVVTLGGPLNPGIVVVMGLLVVVYYASRAFKVERTSTVWSVLSIFPGSVYFYLLPLGVFSVYSLWLGRYNSISLEFEVPLWELYLRIPQGLFYSFTRKIAFPALLFILCFNAYYVRNLARTPASQKMLNAFKWTGWFALLYILLLPLGGYRDYRFYVVRYDVLLPVTLTAVFLFAYSTLLLLRQLPARQRNSYVAFPIAVMLIFTLADEPRFDQNTCERNVLTQLAKEPERGLELTGECTIVSWVKNPEPAEWEAKMRLLRRWKIIE